MMWGPWGWGGWLGSLLLVALVAVGVVALVRQAQTGQPRGGAISARQILDERFARGEIDEEEYQRRRAVLES